MTSDEKNIWDGIYCKVPPGLKSGDEWLDRWTNILDASRDVPVLELGCGSGVDSRFLSERDMDVLATDFSEEALRLTRSNAPGVETKLVDMSRPLPFPDDTFGVVVAGLSLHYFSWSKTVDIASEVRRVLVPDGYLFARFNSTSDEFHGSVDREEIETDFYLIKGLPRRLFCRESIETLFEEWEIENIEERTTGRFGRTKTLLEVAVRKPTPPAL